MVSRISTRMMNLRMHYGFANTAAAAGHGHKEVKISAQDEAYLQEVRKRYVTPDMEKWAYLEYKKHPSTVLSHSDPKSKDFIHSERDEYAEEVTTNSHNDLIDSFKRNLQMQRKVHDILQKMDRPYLRGVPGVHRNVTGGLQDYTTPVNHSS